MRHYCDEAKKEIFSTRGEAERALRNMRKRKKKIGSVYFCGHCQGYHVTHYSYRYGKNMRTSKAKKQAAKKNGTITG